MSCEGANHGFDASGCVFGYLQHRLEAAESQLAVLRKGLEDFLRAWEYGDEGLVVSRALRALLSLAPEGEENQRLSSAAQSHPSGMGSQASLDAGRSAEEPAAEQSQELLADGSGDLCVFRTRDAARNQARRGLGEENPATDTQDAATSGYVEALDAKRPAIATGSWSDVWTKAADDAQERCHEAPSSGGGCSG